MIIGLGHYLSLAAVLFTIGVAGIILNHKDRDLRPKFRMAYRPNEHSQGEIVIGHVSSRRGVTDGAAMGVIVW